MFKLKNKTHFFKNTPKATLNYKIPFIVRAVSGLENLENLLLALSDLNLEITPDNLLSKSLRKAFGLKNVMWDIPEASKEDNEINAKSRWDEIVKKGDMLAPYNMGVQKLGVISDVPVSLRDKMKLEMELENDPDVKGAFNKIDAFNQNQVNKANSVTANELVQSAMDKFNEKAKTTLEKSGLELREEFGKHLKP